MTPPDLPAPGSSWLLERADRDLAIALGKALHAASAARGTRGAGADARIRIIGAAGEIAVARLLGLEPQVVVEEGPVATPDIVTPAGTRIDVKTGLPLVYRRAVNLGWFYVVVERDVLRFTVRTVASGRQIVDAAEVPPARFCPRPGTRELNWLIPGGGLDGAGDVR